MTVDKQERRAAQRQQSGPARDREAELYQFRVLTFGEWCALNRISPATGRRLLKSGKGPQVIRLSDRRIGISVGANSAWQAARSETDA